jgi:hypothetical protein
MIGVMTHMRDDEGGKQLSLRQVKCLRAGVRNCHLRENKYATYTKGAWSVHRVSLGDGYRSVSITTVSKRYA